MSKKNLLLGVLFGTLCLGGVVKADVESIKENIQATSTTNLENFDQPFVFFKTTGKHPEMIIGMPGRKDTETFDFGTKLANGTIKYVESPEEIKNMIPIHYLAHYGDPNLKREEKYLGWSDKPLEMFVEDLLRTYCILRSKPADENPFVRVYKKGYPMKMVLKKSSHMTNLRTYLLKTFNKEGIAALDEKPILALQVEDGGNGLTEEDYDFLDTYFNVIDPTEEEYKEFFVEAQEYLSDMVEIRGHGCHRVGMKCGEIFFEMIKKVKNLGGLKYEAVLGMLFLGIVASPAFKSVWGVAHKSLGDLLGVERDKEIRQYIYNDQGIQTGYNVLGTKDESISKFIFKRVNYKTILAALSAIVGSYLAMKYINGYLSEDQDEELSLEEAEELEEELETA